MRFSKLLGIFIWRTLFSPLNKREILCFLALLIWGISLMGYVVLSANGYFALTTLENEDEIIKAALRSINFGIFLALLLKAIRTDKAMSNEIIYCPITNTDK